MNKEKAIQKQIDDIMDTFDFALCVQILEIYKSWNRGHPKHWEDGGRFQEYLIRPAARECMKAAVKEGFAGHSYFSSYFYEGEDDEGPWVKVELLFGERTYNDGSSYEKTTTTTSIN